MADQTSAAKDAARCIWCGISPANSIEHILPEALGCPEGFILSEGVCRICNSKNGKLDRALLKPFEITTVVKGILRKRGKQPTIDGFSTVASGHDENGPILYFNREKFAVDTPLGKKLGPTSKLDEIENVEWNHLGDGKVNIKIRQKLFFDRMAVRGLFTIGDRLERDFEEAVDRVQLRLPPQTRIDGVGCLVL